MQNFNRKKKKFDSLVDELQTASDQSDNFFDSLGNLQIIEKRKIEELSSLVQSLEYLYTRKNTFKDSIEQFKFALAKDIEQSKAKIEFYNNLRQSKRLVSRKCNDILKNKQTVYKCMDKEYHYLKKQQDLEGKRKIEIEREIPQNKTIRTKEALMRTEQKLLASSENSNQSQIEFYKQYQRGESFKEEVMNPIVASLCNFNKNYYEQMHRNYHYINFPLVNQHQSNIRQSDVIDNFKVNQPKSKYNTAYQLDQDLLQSNHSNQQQNLRSSIQSNQNLKGSELDQNIYIKDDVNSPKKTTLKNTNVIQHYDPPTIQQKQPLNYNNIDFNQPDQSSNQIPYMLNNNNSVGMPINDLVTPYMDQQISEDKMANLWNSNQQKNTQNFGQQNNIQPQRQLNSEYYQQNTNNRQDMNQQNVQQSFGQFQNNNRQFQFQNNNQQEAWKQSEYEQNYYPFQNENKQIDEEKSNPNFNVFSFKGNEIHPDRLTHALKSSDDFFYN